MTLLSRFLGLACLLVPLLPSLILGDDWPQFRGADRSGISREKGLLKAWPKEGPKLLWTYDGAGLGFSGPAILGNTLFTLGTKNDNEEVFLALDAAKGTELWSVPIGPLFTYEGNAWGDGPRSTPTIDGSFAYVLGGQGNLVCFDISQKPREVWKLNMIQDLGGEMMSEWGYSESVLIDGGHLICTPGSDKGTLACLDKKTGKVIWRSTELTTKAPYSSIVSATIHGVPQYIQNSYVSDTDGGMLSGFDAKTGKVLWKTKTFKGHSYAVAPTVIVQDNLVYQTSGYNKECHLFEIGSDFSVTDKYPKTVNKSTMRNTHGGVVLIDGKVYGHSERNTWLCQDFLTGKVVWAEKDQLETQSGSITAAEGLLYLYTEEREVALVPASPEGFSIISQFTLPKKSKYPTTRVSSRSARAWTHPVISNGRLYLRDHEFIFCYDIKQ